MIILHFDLQLQFKYMNYFIYTSHHLTPHGRYELNKLASLPMCGFIAQLVEHRTGIAEVTGSNPDEALIFFQASSFQLLKLEKLLRWSFFTLIYMYVDISVLFAQYAQETQHEKILRGLSLGIALVSYFLQLCILHNFHEHYPSGYFPQTGLLWAYCVYPADKHYRVTWSI